MRAFPLELHTDEGIGLYGTEKNSAAQSKQTCPCHNTCRHHGDGPAPKPPAGHCSTLSWKEDGQPEHHMAKGCRLHGGDTERVESNPRRWQRGCYLAAQTFCISESIPDSHILFPLCTQSLSLGKVPHSPHGKAHACTSRLNLTVWDPRRSSAGACLSARLRHVLLCSGLPRGRDASHRAWVTPETCSRLPALVLGS